MPTMMVRLVGPCSLISTGATMRKAKIAISIITGVIHSESADAPPDTDLFRFTVKHSLFRHLGWDDGVHEREQPQEEQDNPGGAFK